MRPGVELAVGATALVVLGIGAAALGSRHARVGDTDPRRSTYLPGPSGTSGYAQTLERLGVRVDHHRRPVGSIGGGSTSPVVVAFLGPTIPLSAAEGAAIARLRDDLLLAGPTAAPAMRCLGYDVVPRKGGAVAVMRPPASDSLPVPRVRWVLVPRASTIVTDSSDFDEDDAISCVAPSAVRTDTLLQADGRPVAVRVAFADGRSVTLVSDDHLFSNRAIRETAAGPVVLGFVVPRYDRLVVDEYHHGFDATGSLAGATLDWSLRSPWGWGVWQLVAVGVIALLAGSIRFGPAQRIIERRRRSPLEHVRALATALASAGGHDVAVRLIVRGLRRRLGHTGRDDTPAAWLGSLASATRTPRGREALGRLTAIAGRQATAGEVLDAAEDVEILWEELKPS
ncbi:MAG TPA: DUF4350 domain-containing protein [Gemmatimonadales bacterium]|jgi:hypothetical protein